MAVLIRCGVKRHAPSSGTPKLHQRMPFSGNKILVQFDFFIYCLFVWGFTPYQRYFIYLTATVHKAMFPGLFNRYLTSPLF